MTALRRDRSCDVLVVGAGVSGAMMADALCEEGLQVLCCDRRVPLQGSTLASTAMVLHETDLPLVKLARRLPPADARRLWRRCFLAVQALHHRARELGIDAQLETQDSLYLQGNQLDARGLQAEARARRQIGLQVEYLHAREVEEIYGIPRRAALRSGGALAANPRLLAAGFLRAAHARGMEMLSPEEVIEVSPKRGGIEARFRSGWRVRARNLVFTTGYELPKAVPADRYRIYSTWAIATVPQRRAPWPGPCLIWEASSPYLYLRTTQDGRVLCGGGDEPIARAEERDARLPMKREWLRRRLKAVVPGVDSRVDTAWSGAFGVSDAGLPSIGAIPVLKNCFAVLGFGGNGFTYSMMAAQILRNHFAGEPDPDSDLVAFHARVGKK